jgi:hypothetical protein
MADLADASGRPDPTQVSSPAEFVEAMRRLKRWTGWGYRRLEKRAAAAGQVLPRSTLTVALTRPTLPREDLVAAYVRACGCDEDEAARWVAARRRIAAAPAPASPTPLAEPETEAETGVAVGARSVLVVVLPLLIRRARWKARILVVLAVLATALAIGGYVVSSDSPGSHSQTPAQAAPAQGDRDRPGPVTPAAPSSTTASPGSSTTTPPPTTHPGPTTGPPVVPVGLPTPPGTPTAAAPTPPVPDPLPRCSDDTYRHVGDRRVELPAYGGSPDCVLSYGAQGDGVKALQIALIYCNGRVVDLSSTYDQQTYDAVVSIQAATGANPADGIYRPQTRMILNWVHHNGTDGICAKYDGP